jgi:hypothetical protein
MIHERDEDGTTLAERAPDQCDRCDHQAMHFGSDGQLCCRCHIAAGNPPANWHRVCVAESRRLGWIT